MDCEDYQGREQGNPERNQKQSTEGRPISRGFEQTDCRKDCSADDNPDGIMKGWRNVLFELHNRDMSGVLESDQSKAGGNMIRVLPVHPDRSGDR